MYFYTPVIVSPFAQFVEEFGETLTFGSYCNTCTKEDLQTAISDITSISQEAYRQLCCNAHERVKTYTWDNYVGRMINLMKEEMR